MGMESFTSLTLKTQLKGRQVLNHTVQETTPALLSMVEMVGVVYLLKSFGVT